MNEPATFQAFSLSHVAALCTLALTTAALCVACKLPKCRNSTRWIAIGFGAVVAVHEIAWIVYEGFTSRLTWEEDLPFHLCDASLIAAILALLTRRQVFYEFAYFFGFGGATQALITPELQNGFPDPICVKFFFSHGTILASVLFLTIVFGMRPYPRSLVRMTVAGTLYMIVAGLVNIITGGNYGYLRTKPINASLLDHLGPWPWYWGSLWMIGFVLLFILYAPFFIRDLFRSRHANSASVR